ncbi:M23 family metallopeptidase [Candidatus Palauibacter sp.]|uniref:M23 family metallopeptidase n=1 Tax=Candidatus Palauibacter sp. TaxID=3101350 RepID=UPI003B02796F
MTSYNGPWLPATVLLVALSEVPAPEPVAAQSAANVIEAVTIHPPVAAPFQCSEHALGAEDHVPDALAADCVVVRRTGGPNGNLASLYTGDGTRNEDWHSWREPLLAPFDGEVFGVQINPDSTVPGVRGEGRSSAIGFRQWVDGEPTDVYVAYVHVREVVVSEGDTVRAGEPVARIGNNGSSFHPHVHVGAFRGDMMSEDAVPLQVRMDLAAMGRLRGTVGS